MTILDFFCAYHTKTTPKMPLFSQDADGHGLSLTRTNTDLPGEMAVEPISRGKHGFSACRVAALPHQFPLSRTEPFCHLDRSDAQHHEVEKSGFELITITLRSQMSRLRFASLDMTGATWQPL
jgi:hypothetical protein